MSCCVRWAGVGLALLLPLSAVRAEEFNPAKTRAVLVGVLQWKNGLAGFPAKNRKDQELRDLLVRRGTPKANIALLLDQQATLPNIRAVLNKAIRQAEPDSTLIIYYAGHGMKVGDDYCFANYEVEPRRLKETAWSLRELGETLAKHFKGKRVLLWADCCFSGGLEVVVERLGRAKIVAAHLTSAGPANTSTRNWTFTQSLLDSLGGEPLVDANGDGKITLAEAAVEVREAMRHREGQLHGYRAKGVPDDFVLARTSGPRSQAVKTRFPVGSYVQVLGGTQGRPLQIGRVVAVKGDTCTVQFYDYSEKRLAAYDVKHLQASTRTATQPQVLDAGMKPDCEVEWKGTWYAAKVIKKADGKFFIHYVGWEKSWDEWVRPQRIRFPENGKRPEARPKDR